MILSIRLRRGEQICPLFPVICFCHHAWSVFKVFSWKKAPTKKRYRKAPKSRKALSEHWITMDQLLSFLQITAQQTRSDKRAAVRRVQFDDSCKAESLGAVKGDERREQQTKRMAGVDKNIERAKAQAMKAQMNSGIPRIARIYVEDTHRYDRAVAAAMVELNKTGANENLFIL